MGRLGQPARMDVVTQIMTVYKRGHLSMHKISNIVADELQKQKITLGSTLIIQEQEFEAIIDTDFNFGYSKGILVQCALFLQQQN